MSKGPTTIEYALGKVGTGMVWAEALNRLGGRSDRLMRLGYNFDGRRLGRAIALLKENGYIVETERNVYESTDKAFNELAAVETDLTEYDGEVKLYHILADSVGKVKFIAENPELFVWAVRNGQELTGVASPADAFSLARSGGVRGEVVVTTSTALDAQKAAQRARTIRDMINRHDVLRWSLEELVGMDEAETAEVPHRMAAPTAGRVFTDDSKTWAENAATAEQGINQQIADLVNKRNAVRKVNEKVALFGGWEKFMEATEAALNTELDRQDAEKAAQEAQEAV